MEILNRREQIGAKKLPPVIGDDVEKAGKSKFGVVKVGDGINVSKGVISVPQNTGALELLYTQPETPEAASTEITLAHNVSDYKFLLIVQKGSASASTAFMETMILSVESAPYNTISINSGSNGTQVHLFAINGNKIKDNQSGNANTMWYKVYGIK